MTISILQFVFGNWNNISVEFMAGLVLIWLAAVAIKVVRIIQASQAKAKPVPGLVTGRMPESPAAA